MPKNNFIKSKSVSFNDKGNLNTLNSNKSLVNIRIFESVRQLKYDFADKVIVIKKTIESIKKNLCKSLVFLLNSNHAYLGLYYYDSENHMFVRLYSPQSSISSFKFILVKEALFFSQIKQRFITFSNKRVFTNNISAVIIN